jgi:cell division protein ZapA
MSPSSEKSVKVTILGDEYSIKSDVDLETTKKVAEYVNSKIEQIQSSISSKEKLKIAVLSAINIAGELFEYKLKCEKCLQKLEDVEGKNDKTN